MRARPKCLPLTPDEVVRDLHWVCYDIRVGTHNPLYGTLTSHIRVKEGSPPYDVSSCQQPGCVFPC